MSFLTFFKLFALSFILLEIRILKFTFSVFIAGKPLNLDSKLNILHYKLPPTCCYGFKLKKTTNVFVFNSMLQTMCMAYHVAATCKPQHLLSWTSERRRQHNTDNFASREENKTQVCYLVMLFLLLL